LELARSVLGVGGASKPFNVDATRSWFAIEIVADVGVLVPDDLPADGIVLTTANLVLKVNCSIPRRRFAEERPDL
jgi:hypothetical protein